MDVQACTEAPEAPEVIVLACDRAIEAGRSVGTDLADLHYNRARALDSLGDAEGAESAYRLALKIDPQHQYSMLDLGWLLGVAGAWDEVLSLAEQAIEVDPGYNNSYDLKGWAQRHLGQAEEALEALTIARALDPGDNWTVRELSLTYRDLGDLDRAEAEARRAIGNDAEDAWAYYALGLAQIDKQEIEPALATLDTAIALDGGHLSFHLERWYALRELGQMAVALEQIDAAEEQWPGHVDIHASRGWTYLMMDSLAPAEAEFRLAINRSGSASWSYYGLAITLARDGQGEEAIEVLETALDLEYNSANASEVVRSLLRAGSILQASRASRLVAAAAGN
ncbi:MAG: tetratricopeptide repeat protein [Pseudomonadota bacterium]